MAIPYFARLIAANNARGGGDIYSGLSTIPDEYPSLVRNDIDFGGIPSNVAGSIIRRFIPSMNSSSPPPGNNYFAPGQWNQLTGGDLAGVGWWNWRDNATKGGLIANLIEKIFAPKPGAAGAPAVNTTGATGSPSPAAAPRSRATGAPASVAPLMRGRDPGTMYNAARAAFSPTYQQLNNPGSAIGPITGQPTNIATAMRNARGLGTIAGGGFGIDSFSATARGEAYRKNQL